MTGLVLLSLLVIAGAIMLGLRVREQRRTIERLEREVAEARAHDHDNDVRHTRLFGTVAHELRSPIAAILGYEELLAEGVFGELDARTTEALARIRSSARQLLTLTEGMHELSGRDNGELELEEVDHARALRNAYHRAAPEAEARRVRLAAPQGADVPIPGTGVARLLDAILDAVCGAALKGSADRTVHSSVAVEESLVRYRLGNTGLDPETIAADPLASGAGLRIAIAQRMTERLGGSVHVARDGDGTAIDVLLPRSVG